LAQALGELSLIFVVVQIGKVNDAGNLLTDDLHNPRMRMPERVYAQSSNKIEVLSTLEVIQENALPALKGNRIAIVGWEKKASFEIGNFIEAGHE